MSRSVGWRSSLLGVGLLFSASAFSSQPEQPTFRAGTELVAIDVVVVDGRRRPIRDLDATQFEVFEDGVRQTVTAFEVRDTARGAVPRLPDDGVGPGILEDPTSAASPGRILGFIVDDLGIDVRGLSAIKAVQSWVAHDAVSGDRITLATTSGTVAWKGTITADREDLVRRIGLIRCRRPSAEAFFDGMSEWEAYQLVSGREDANILDGRSSAGAESSRSGTDVIMNRADATRRGKAFEVYLWWRVRAKAILSAAASMSRDFPLEKARRSIIVLSQSFIRDDDIKLADEATEFAQRADTHMYFIDTRGLVPGGSMFGDRLRELNLGLDLAGAEQVAAQTGGDVRRNSNDLLGALKQVVDESSYYYVLGFTPLKSPDNEWRKLRVKVHAKGVTVRSRRAYFAREGG